MPRRLSRIFTAATLVLLAWVRGAFAQSESPAGYYNSARNLTGLALKTALATRIKGHTALPYTSTNTDTWDALMFLDEDPAAPASVTLIYSGLTNLKTNTYTGGVGAGKWDREHLFPQSYGLVELSASSRAKSDVFNLRPIDYTVNSTRGNLYYDKTGTPFRTTAGAPGSSYDTDSWEPRDTDKGVVARAAFYMATRYDGSDSDVPDLELSDTPNAATFQFGKLTILLAWNRLHPPTELERERNQLVYSQLQHNRNPFIDDPAYAESVFLGKSPYDAWRSVQFGEDNVGADPLAADTADPDHDGLNNLAEYILGLDALVADASTWQKAALTTGSGPRYLDLTYVRNASASGVSISYESSPDLLSWSPASVVSIGITPLPAQRESVKVRVSATPPSLFLRIRMQKP